MVGVPLQSLDDKAPPPLPVFRMISYLLRFQMLAPPPALQCSPMIGANLAARLEKKKERKKCIFPILSGSQVPLFLVLKTGRQCFSWSFLLPVLLHSSSLGPPSGEIWELQEEKQKETHHLLPRDDLFTFQSKNLSHPLEKRLPSVPS